MATAPSFEERPQFVTVTKGSSQSPGLIRFVIALALMVGVLAVLPPKASGWLAAIVVIGALVVSQDQLKAILG